MSGKPSHVFSIATCFVLSYCSGSSNGKTDAAPDSGADAGGDSGTSNDCIQPTATPNCEDGWCRVEPGCFILGSPETETPSCRGAYTENQVQVTLTRPFVIQQHEVTQAQWEAVGFTNPANSADLDSDKPVTLITWFEAMAYANALSDAEGLDKCYDLNNCTGTVGSGCPDDPFYESGCLVYQGTTDIIVDLYRCEGEVYLYENWYECPGYRLPTTAEWEYAARGGTTTATYNGDILVATEDKYEMEPVLEPIAWYGYNSGMVLHTVCGKQPNNWGLYDMLGNAFEWIDYVYTGFSLSWAEGTYDPLVDPQGAGWDVDTRRSVKGGFFGNTACYVRAADHTGLLSYVREQFAGFRLVRTVIE